jgi:HSP20 family protein
MARARSDNAESSSRRDRQQGANAGRGGRTTETRGAETRGTDTRASEVRGARGTDLEQQVPVSREGTSRGTALSRQESSLLPSIFGAPPSLLSGAFMSNPFGFMRRMTDEMNRIFENAGMGTALAPFGGTQQGGMGTWMPQIEVQQRNNELVVRADLPGLKRDDVTVEVEDGVLTLSGERRQENEEERQGFYRSERSYGSFYRAIPLPEGVNEDDISATFGDGVLEVRVPVPEQQQRRGRRVEIR